MSDFRPLRLAVMFDGETNVIQNMAQDAVGQFALMAQGLGRSILVKGAQTMDLQQRGGVINWSGWEKPEAFDSARTLQLASCYRSNDVILGALKPIAIENEKLSTLDIYACPPRIMREKVDAILIATGREPKDMAKELSGMKALRALLNGEGSSYNPEMEIKKSPLACTPQSRVGHRGLIAQGTRVFSLATILGVEGMIQEKLSAPTQGMSFHGKAGEVGKLVEAMAITLADPDNAHRRLEGSRFKQLADLRPRV